MTFCADSHITLYSLVATESKFSNLVIYLEKNVVINHNYFAANVDLIRLQAIDISALCVHPACVVSITLTSLRTESCVNARRDNAESLIVNVSGRLLLVQRLCISPEGQEVNGPSLVSCFFLL